MLICSVVNFVTSHLSWSLLEWCWNNVVWILDFIFKFCLYKLLHHTFKDLLRNLAKCCIKKDVPLVEFTYLVFTHMPSESYGRWLRSVIKGSTVFWWKFWFWLWFHSLAYQFAATRTECCITTGLCFLTESAFSLHSFLPPPSLPFLLLSLPCPPPLHSCHHSILLSMPTMLLHPIPTPRHCWSFSLQFNLILFPLV